MGKNYLAHWCRVMRKTNLNTSIVPSFDEGDSGKAGGGQGRRAHVGGLL